MRAAKLGGIPGAAAVHSRSTNEGTRQHQGTFAFHAKDAEELMQFYESGERVELIAVIDGKRQWLPVVLTHVALGAGIAFFSGTSEAVEAEEGARSAESA